MSSLLIMVTWAGLVFSLNTRRVNNMKQQIKAGDYVYIPHYSRKALLVIKPIVSLRDFMSIIGDEGDEYAIEFNKDGGDRISSEKQKYHLGPETIEPIAFLATPENKAKIEQFYGCELESPTTKGINNAKQRNH